MKTTLVYGDSNTYGQTNWPYVGEPRLPYEQRWTSRVQHHFENQLRVLPEGLGGRTAADVQSGDDTHRNGREHFQAIFCSHQPVDVLVIALGTNDCQSRYGRSAQQIYGDLLWYREVAIEWSSPDFVAPQVVYVAPPSFDVAVDDVYFGGRETVREELATLMMQSKEMDIIHLDNVATSLDGVHFSPEGHRQIAIAVKGKLKEML